jgi:hypothetical protein
MGRLAGFKYREVARKLRTLGFAFDRPGPCRHEVWRHRETGRKVPLQAERRSALQGSAFSHPQ